MEFLTGFAIGAVITWFLIGIWMALVTHRTRREITNLISTIEEQTKNIISARVELHHGVFYVYNTQDGSFMAQGTTMAELRQRIESRWQDAQVYVTEGDHDALQALKATGSDLETRGA